MQKRGWARWKGKKLSMPSAVEITISPGSTSRTNSAPMMSRAQVSEASTQRVAELAEHQRPDAERVAHADELGAGHRDDGEGALDAAERVLQPLGDGLLDRAGHQVDDALGVRARLEDRAVLDQLLAQRRALVRLPLWATAQPPMASSAKSGCTSRIWVSPLEPAVE